MITLSVIPNFKGTNKERLKAFIQCLIFDLIIFYPFIKHLLQ